jgi:lysylphosphatidylglycerol synthetase-like protein (DUF2156 family)
MRFPSMLMAVSTTLLFGSARAALAEQVKVEVTTADSHAVWYTDPVWLGLGAVAVLIVIVLAIMASRSGQGKTTTTVIR